MHKESKNKVSKLPLTFNAEAGQQADVAVPMAGQPAEVEIRHNLNPRAQGTENAKSVFRNIELEKPSTATTQPEPRTQNPSLTTSLTAQDLLSKSEAELKELVPEKSRETHNLLKYMKIMTAIMLGKDKNKELAHALQTDKSFTSKQIKELEEQGLVKREGEGRETKYVVDPFNLMKFLQTKVIIKWGKKEESSNVQPKAALGRGQEEPQTGGGQSPPAVRK